MDIFSVNVDQLTGKVADEKASFFVQALRSYMDINFDGKVDKNEALAGIQIVEGYFYYEYAKGDIYQADNILRGKEISLALKMAYKANALPDQPTPKFILDEQRTIDQKIDLSVFEEEGSKSTTRELISPFKDMILADNNPFYWQVFHMFNWYDELPDPTKLKKPATPAE